MDVPVYASPIWPICRYRQRVSLVVHLGPASTLRFGGTHVLHPCGFDQLVGSRPLFPPL